MHCVTLCRVGNYLCTTLIVVKGKYYVIMKNSKKDFTMRNLEIQLELPNLNTYKFIIADNETDFYSDGVDRKNK